MMELKPTKAFDRAVAAYEETNRVEKELHHALVMMLEGLAPEEQVDLMTNGMLILIVRDCNILKIKNGTYIPYLQRLLERLKDCFEEVV